MSRHRKDFIMVRLSAAGREFAGEGATLRIATMHMHYLFADDAAVEILRTEWRVLGNECDAAGSKLFAEVESSAGETPEEEM